jgi:hypothetical protein
LPAGKSRLMSFTFPLGSAGRGDIRSRPPSQRDAGGGAAPALQSLEVADQSNAP